MRQKAKQDLNEPDESGLDGELLFFGIDLIKPSAAIQSKDTARLYLRITPDTI